MSCEHTHISDSESRCVDCGIIAQGVVYSLHDRISVLRSSVALAQKAMNRALPYLIDCIHEIACDEHGHDHGDACPAETQDETVRLLREALAACRGWSR